MVFVKLEIVLNLKLQIYRGSLHVGGSKFLQFFLILVRFVITKNGENINIHISIILILMITN